MKRIRKYDRVKLLFQQGKSVSEIAKELGMRHYWVRLYIEAIKLNHPSPAQYLDDLARAKGANSSLELRMKRNGCNTALELFNNDAKRLGYKDFSHYRKIRRILCGRQIPETTPIQHSFENKIKNRNSSFLETLASENSPEERELIEEVQYFVSQLPARERKVIESIFYEDKTHKQAGGDIGVTAERARQIKEEAFNKLRIVFESGTRLSKAIEKRVLYPYEEGELLLVYFYSKTEIPKKKIAEKLNELWHEGKPVRTWQTIQTISSNKYYQDKMKRIWDSYL